MSDINDMIRRGEELFRIDERNNIEALWCEIAEFILPNQDNNFQGEDSPGQKKTRRLYDSTAIQANHDLAAAIHSTLTNPSTQWSKIRFKDEELNNDAETVAWLENANKLIHTAYNESNFDTEVSKNYLGFPSLGTMVLFHEEVGQEKPLSFEGFRFKAIHLSEIAIAESANSDVDTVYRKFKMTAKQLVEKFGTSVSQELKELSMQKPEHKIEIMHCVFKRDPKKVKLNESGLASGKKRPFASVYVDLQHKDVLEEDGYYEFPYYVTRWMTMPGEVYGRSPGHIALPDVRTLNLLKKLTLEAVDRAVNPPLLATERGVLGSLDMRPRKISIVKDVNAIREVITQARFDVSNFTSDQLMNSIKTTFFLDKLLLPPRTETGEMTAFEVSQRLEQMQKVLGSTLSRLNSEFLTPLVVRSFKIMLRGGALGPLPQLLLERGINVDINFVNALSRAQQVEDVSNIQAWVTQLAGIAQINPQVVDWINVDGIAKHIAKIRHIPEIAITNEDEVVEIREQRAQQAQQAQALEAATQMADIQSKAGGSDGGEPTS